MKFAALKLAALGFGLVLILGCESTDGGGSAAVYYGNEFYDPWYYGSTYYEGDLIVTPPENRPEAPPPRPTHPIAPPPISAPRPMPMPSIPTMPMPRARVR